MNGKSRCLGSHLPLTRGLSGVLLLLLSVACPAEAQQVASPAGPSSALPAIAGFPQDCSVPVDPAQPQWILNQGHKGAIDRIEVNADGSLVLTSGSNSARLWNVASKGLVHALAGETRDANHGEYALSAAFQADGKSIIAGNRVGLQGWSIGTQFPCDSAELAGKRVDQVEMASSGTAVVAVRDDLTDDAASGVLIKAPSARNFTPVAMPGLAIVESIATSADGRFVAASGHSGTGYQARKTEPGKVIVWDVEKRVPAASFTVPPGMLSRVRFGGDGKHLFVLTGDDLLRIAISDGSVRKLATAGFDDFALSERAGIAAMLKKGDDSARISLMPIDGAGAPQPLQLPPGASPPSAIAISADGNHLAIGFRDGAIGVFDLSARQFTAHWTPPSSGIAGTLELSRNANAAGRWDQGSAHYLDLRTGSERKIASLPLYEGFSVSYDVGIFGEEKQFDELTGISPDGEVLANGVIWSGSASLWDTRTGKKLRDLPYGIPGMTDVVFPDGARRMFRHDWHDMDDDSVSIEEMKSGKESKDSPIFAHQPQILYLQPFADGRGAAAGLYDGTVVISDPRHPDAGIGLINKDDFIVGLDIDRAGELVAVGYRSQEKHRVDLIDLSASGRRSIALSSPVASIEAMRLFPSGRFVAVAGSSAIVLASTESLQTVAVLPVAAKPDALQISPDDRLLAVTADGVITFFGVASPARPREIVTFTHLPGAAPLASAPGGYFDAQDLGNLAGFSWIMPDDPTRPIAGEVFMRDYFEPQLMARLLACEATRFLEEEDCSTSLSTVRPLIALNRVRPQVTLLKVEQGTRPDQAIVTIEIHGASDPSQRNGKTDTAAYDLRLFRDGQLVARVPGGGESGAAASDPLAWQTANRVEKTLYHIPVRLAGVGGEVNFSAYAFNEDRVKSDTAQLAYSRAAATAAPRRRAYVIAMGVDSYAGDGSRNLSYAAKDARDLSAALAGLPGYDVVPVTLLSQAGQRSQATRANLHAVLEVLAGNAAARDKLKGVARADELATAAPDDLVILSFSGHGLTMADGRFYLLPSDADPAHIPSPGEFSGLISSQELAAWFEKVDAGQLALVIDACHSAASVEEPGFKPGPMGDSGFGQLAYDKGMRILAASQADDIALEVSSAKQGLLTYALLEGLQSRQGRLRADGNGDGLRLSEWLSYGERRTPSLYQDALAGKLKMVSRNSGPDPRFPETAAKRAQFPRLFDFSRKDSDPLIRQSKLH